ncbi:PhzF family phenazine biosynthesis protein [Methanocella conradii]|uniref:PhzF family phenazine biosynthesis protein n=1 Tax=Methanocella conradii TaxID=1175444 RepID=UPI00157C91A6
MAGHTFYMVDVFAEEKYAGNQLAVFMDAARLSPEEMQKLANETHFSETTFILSGEEHDGGYDVRVFTKFASVPEDPATGSGNGCLAAYLVKHRYFGEPRINIRVEQGYEMGRPSLLFLRSEEINGSIEVRVGGKVIPVAKCTLL